MDIMVKIYKCINVSNIYMNVTSSNLTHFLQKGRQIFDLYDYNYVKLYLILKIG